ncbi:MAG: hypothetical protein LBC65_03210 [Oscillospiraceae bacterium]|jgi:hypothetical protein|nr:hypothetical protein [Oscillospiraceae bacterium]
MKRDNVLTLERAILDGSVGDVTHVLRELGPFEFTARALALSMRFGDAEKTELLLKSGAMLEYDLNSNLLRLEYSTVYSKSEIWGADYMAKYSLFPVFDRVTAREMFFGTLYDPAGGADPVNSPSLVSADGDERAPASLSVRAECVDVVCKRRALDRDSMEEMLYYSVMFGCGAITDALISHGARLNESRDISSGYVRLISSYDDIRVAVGEALRCELDKTSAQFFIHDGMVTFLLRFESWLTARWGEFLTLLAYGRPSELSLDAVAARLVELDSDGKLTQLAEFGLLRSVPTLIESAIDGGRNRALAFLLDYNQLRN